MLSTRASSDDADIVNREKSQRFNLSDANVSSMVSEVLGGWESKQRDVKNTDGDGANPLPVDSTTSRRTADWDSFLLKEGDLGSGTREEVAGSSSSSRQVLLDAERENLLRSVLLTTGEKVRENKEEELRRQERAYEAMKSKASNQSADVEVSLSETAPRVAEAKLSTSMRGPSSERTRDGAGRTGSFWDLKKQELDFEALKRRREQDLAEEEEKQKRKQQEHEETEEALRIERERRAVQRRQDQTLENETLRMELKDNDRLESEPMLRIDIDSFFAQKRRERDVEAAELERQRRLAADEERTRVQIDLEARVAARIEREKFEEQRKLQSSLSGDRSLDAIERVKREDPQDVERFETKRIDIETLFEQTLFGRDPEKRVATKIEPEKNHDLPQSGDRTLSVMERVKRESEIKPALKIDIEDLFEQKRRDQDLEAAEIDRKRRVAAEQRDIEARVAKMLDREEREKERTLEQNEQNLERAALDDVKRRTLRMELERLEREETQRKQEDLHREVRRLTDETEQEKKYSLELEREIQRLESEKKRREQLQIEAKNRADEKIHELDEIKKQEVEAKKLADDKHQLDESKKQDVEAKKRADDKKQADEAKKKEIEAKRLADEKKEQEAAELKKEKDNEASRREKQRRVDDAAERKAEKVPRTDRQAPPEQHAEVTTPGKKPATGTPKQASKQTATSSTKRKTSPKADAGGFVKCPKRTNAPSQTAVPEQESPEAVKKGSKRKTVTVTKTVKVKQSEQTGMFARCAKRQKVDSSPTADSSTTKSSKTVTKESGSGSGGWRAMLPQVLGGTPPAPRRKKTQSHSHDVEKGI